MNNYSAEEMTTYFDMKNTFNDSDYAKLGKILKDDALTEIQKIAEVYKLHDEAYNRYLKETGSAPGGEMPPELESLIQDSNMDKGNPDEE